jgi:uncharacterized protein YecE (DUF72 family)
LVAAQRATGMRKIHVGSMGWSYDFWKGNFYPKNLASNEFLAYYSKQFDTVEVDSTFYKIPSKKTVLDWREQTPNDFVFSLKFPRIITHVKMLRSCEEETRVFLEHVELLGEKLGPLLLQFPPAFGDDRIPLLREFLLHLTRRHRYVVEVRNKKLLTDNLYVLLRDNNIALAWVESPSMSCVSEATSDFIYVRWEGDRKKINGTFGKTEVDRAGDIDLWAKWLKPFMEVKMEAFGYFSKYYSGFPPSDIPKFLNSIKTK